MSTTFHGESCSKCGETLRYIKEKRCVHCRREQGRNRIRRESLDCRKKRLARIKKWTKNNPDKFHANQAKYRRNHMEATRERHALYAATHPHKPSARCLDYQARYRVVHSEQKKAYRKARRSTDREQLAAWLRVHPGKSREYVGKRRAIKKMATIGDRSRITKWIASWEQKKAVICYWCGDKFPGKDCHADHVMPLSKGGQHSLSNLVVSCLVCNLSKNNRLPAVWNRTLEQPRLVL